MPKRYWCVVEATVVLVISIAVGGACGISGTLKPGTKPTRLRLNCVVAVVACPLC